MNEPQRCQATDFHFIEECSDSAALNRVADDPDRANEQSALREQQTELENF